MRIGFDMDGVLIDHAGAKMLIADTFGITLAPEQTPSDIMRRVIPRDIWREIQQLLYDSEQYALRPPVMQGARPALQEITEKEIPFFLISRRKNPAVAVALLEKRGLWPLFFNEKNAFFVDAPEDKNVKALELGITHYLDDELRVLEVLADVENKFLFDKYGAFPDAESYSKIRSWKEFLEKL